MFFYDFNDKLIDIEHIEKSEQDLVNKYIYYHQMLSYCLRTWSKIWNRFMYN